MPEKKVVKAKKKTTLQSIADELGLSKFAVSRALSGKSGVSEETRELVRTTARGLGYSRQPSQSQKPLGMIFDDTDIVNSELHMQVQSGAQREAQHLGVSLRIYWTHHPDDIETIANNSSGLIIVGPHDTDSLKRAYNTGVPIVRRGWVDPLEPVDQVAGTDSEAGAAVAQHLIELGHREIIYVHGKVGLRGRIERLHGIRHATENLEGMIVHELAWEDGGSFSQAFRKAYPDGFSATAFFCSHDGLAVTVISELLSWGYRIPEDVSVVGFGDYSTAQQIFPSLTTVKTHGSQMGAMCVQLLVNRIKTPGSPSHPMRVQIPNTLAIRNSTGRVSTATSDRRLASPNPPLGASA